MSLNILPSLFPLLTRLVVQLFPPPILIGPVAPLTKADDTNISARWRRSRQPDCGKTFRVTRQLFSLDALSGFVVILQAELFGSVLDFQDQSFTADCFVLSLALLEGADLSQLSSKKIRKQLESDYDTDFTDRYCVLICNNQGHDSYFHSFCNRWHFTEVGGGLFTVSAKNRWAMPDSTWVVAFCYACGPMPWLWSKPLLNGWGERLDEGKSWQNIWRFSNPHRPGSRSSSVLNSFRRISLPYA